MSGLTGCDGTISVQCQMKIIEITCSSLLLIATIHQIIKNAITQGRFTSPFVLFIETFISLSLIFNILHCIWGYEYYLLSIEIMFSQMTFLTIIYFVGYHTYNKQIHKKIMLLIYTLFFLFYFGLTIFRSVENPKKSSFCTEIWFLVVDSCAIGLSIFLFVSYRCKEIEEKQRNEKHFRQSLTTLNIKSPFKKMWILIGINIFCAIVGFSRTIALIISNPQSCQFFSDGNQEAIIDLIFTFASYYAGICSAVIIFWYRRKQITKSMNKSGTQNSEDSHSGPYYINRVQMVDRSTFLTNISETNS